MLELRRSSTQKRRISAEEAKSLISEMVDVMLSVFQRASPPVKPSFTINGRLETEAEFRFAIAAILLQALEISGYEIEGKVDLQQQPPHTASLEA